MTLQDWELQAEFVVREGGIDIGRNASAVRLRTLVDEHGKAVHALLRGLEHHHSVREELWGDVFMLASRRIEELDRLSVQQQRRWLLRVARNLTANVARRAVTRRQAYERLVREPLDVGLSAEDEYFARINLPAHSERIADVQEAWWHLSDAHREILALDALGHKGPAIADQLGISHQAARSRLMRARQAFLDAYSGQVGAI